MNLIKKYKKLKILAEICIKMHQRRITTFDAQSVP
jgi:hypothetical protein